MAITYTENSKTDNALGFTINGLDMNKDYIVKVDCEILNDPITPTPHPIVTKTLPFKTNNIPLATGTLSAVNKDVNGTSSVYYEYTISSIQGITRTGIEWKKQGTATYTMARSVDTVTNGNNTGGASAFEKDVYYEFALRVDYGDGWQTIATCVAMPNPTLLTTATLAFVSATSTDVTLKYTLGSTAGISSAHIEWVTPSGTTIGRDVTVSISNTVTIGGLEDGQNYDFKFTAYYGTGADKVTANASGSTSSTPIVSTTHSVSLSKSNADESSITVSWNPTDDSNVSSITIQYKKSSSSSYGTPSTVTGSTNKTFSGLTANTNYDFKVTVNWTAGTGDVNTNTDTVTATTSAIAEPTSKTISFDSRSASVSQIQSMLAKLGDTGRSGFSKSGSYIAGQQDNWCTYSPTAGCSDFSGNDTTQNATEAFPSSIQDKAYQLDSIYEYYKGLGINWYKSNAPTTDSSRGKITSTQSYHDSEGYSGSLNITWHETIYLSQPITTSYWHFMVARDYYWTASGTVTK